MLRLAESSTTEKVMALRHPGRPPHGWPPAAAAILALTLVAIALILVLGSALHGSAGYFLRERKAGTYLSFALLVSSGVVCALMAARFRSLPFARFWAVSAGLFVYTGCDDLFVFHERIDRWVHFALGLDPENLVTDHFDDAIVGVYALAAVALAWRFRVDVLRFPFMVLTMIPAFAAFVVMLFFDWRHGPKPIEDSAKILSGALILIGFLAAWLEARQQPPGSRRARLTARERSAHDRAPTSAV